MDVHCKFCGEPVDMNEFHNGTNSFQKIYNLFKEYGCPIADQAIDGKGAFEMKLKTCQHAPIVDDVTLDAIDAIQDLLGDDADGAASILQDLWNPK